MTYYYATTHPTTTSITQYKSFGVHRLLGLLTVTGCIAMTCPVFDKVLVLDTPLQNLQSEGNSRSFLDELTEPGEEEIIDVISDDSLPGFRPFEDKTTIKARNAERFTKQQMKENSFVANTICTISFHILFYVFFTLICYHHVYQIK